MSEYEVSAKVYDADGVKIRAGETLFHIRSGDSVIARQLMAPDKFEDTDFARHFASEYTHRAPVLAADGKPLREGETVWLNDKVLKSKLVVRGEPFKVIAFDKKGNVGVLDQDDIAKGREIPWWFEPTCLTHECPDSWERLKADIYREIETDKGMRLASKLAEAIVLRCRALAERGQ